MMNNGKAKYGAARKQSGFTLIELVIVVTILGVLASMAIPAYKDYSIRSKVAEASSMFSSVKTAYTTYFSINGKLPSNLDQIDLLSDNRNDFSGDYIRWIQIQPSGNVRARTRDILVLGPAADKVMEFRPVVANGKSSINWAVYSRDNHANWVPPKYLPSL